MRKLKYFCLVILAFSLLIIPAAAQKGPGSSRSNRGGVDRGHARASLVHSENKKKDKDRGRNPDNDKNRGKHKGETRGRHKAKGHRH